MFAHSYTRVHVSVPVFNQEPGLSQYARVLKMAKENKVFHSVESRGQVIKAGVYRVAHTGEFRMTSWHVKEASAQDTPRWYTV